jgi:hypothetical protein
MFDHFGIRSFVKIFDELGIQPLRFQHKILRKDRFFPNKLRLIGLEGAVPIYVQA